MDISNFVSGVTENISNKIEPRSIPASVVGDAIIDLAQLTKTAVDAKFDVSGGTYLQNQMTGLTNTLATKFDTTGATIINAQLTGLTATVSNITSGKAGIVGEMTNTITGSQFSGFTSTSGRVIASTGSAARARTATLATLSGETYTVFYNLKLNGGVAPRLQFSNSSGVAQSTFTTANTGLNKTVITISLNGNWGFGVHCTAASDFELDYVVLKGASAAPETFASGVTNAFLYRSLEKVLANSDRIAVNESNILLVSGNTPTLTITESGIPGGVQLFNKAAAIENTFIDRTNGNLTTNANYTRSDFIKINSGQTLYFIRTTNVGYFGAFYDINKSFITSDISAANVTGSTGSINTPANAEYIRVNVSNSLANRETDKNSFFLSHQNVPYQPYFKQAVTKINGYDIYASGANSTGTTTGSTSGLTSIPTRSGISWIASQEDDAAFRITSGALTGLSSTGATISSATVTITGATGSIELSNSSAFSFRQRFVAEAIIKTNNAVSLGIRSGSAVQRNFEFNATAQTITETISGTIYTPGNNIDFSQEVRVRMYFDTLEQTCFLQCMYFNSGGTGNLEQQNHFYTDDFTFTGSTTNRLAFRHSTNSTSTIRNLNVFAPGLAVIGSSIMAGSGAAPSEYSPVPRFKPSEVIAQQPGYWIDSLSGNKRIHINCGFASSDSNHTASGITNVLRFKPEVIFTDFGITNDISHTPVIDDATTKANVLAAISACTAAGVLLVGMECLPRNVFSSGDDIRAKETNAWLSGLTATYPLFTVAKAYDSFVNPSIAGKINPFYATDGTHPNPYGQRIIARAVYKALSNI